MGIWDNYIINANLIPNNDAYYIGTKRDHKEEYKVNLYKGFFLNEEL